MADIPQDKAVEYMQVAALLSFMIDTLVEVAKDQSLTVEEFRGQIALLNQDKAKIIADAEEREQRYKAASWLFSLKKAGQIRSTPLIDLTNQ